MLAQDIDNFIAMYARLFEPLPVCGHEENSGFIPWENAEDISLPLELFSLRDVGISYPYPLFGELDDE